MGQKPDDWNTISLCRECHANQHRNGEIAFEAFYKFSMAEMARDFANASPKAPEIRRIKQERAHG